MINEREGNVIMRGRPAKQHKSLEIAERMDSSLAGP